MAKDTVFCAKRTLNCKGKLLLLESPLVMGILNITPDSFYDGGKWVSTESAVDHALKMIELGADIIDIGAQSTRPGADFIQEDKELQRIIPVIEAIIKENQDAIISVDTFQSRVAKEAVEAGACIINDVSAGMLDDQMFETIAELKVPYVLMHMKGTPKNMQQNTVYKDVMSEIINFFAEKISVLHGMGVMDIILDPGFGFGKTLKHNFHLLRELKAFKLFNLPLIAGVSRKSMIWKAIQSDPEHALIGTVAANTIALMNGANILRVHDVREAVETINIVSYAKNS